MAHTDSKGKLRYGQQYDPNDDLVIPYTERIHNETSGSTECDVQGQARTEINPQDAQSWLVREFTPPTDALEAYSLVTPGSTDLQLPDVLLSIAVTYNTASGNGVHAQDGDGISISSSPSLNLSLASKAQGSASVMPDIQPIIKQYWARNVPCLRVLLYMANGFSRPDVINRLNDLLGVTVNNWPNFQPAGVTFTLKGETVSVSADADVQQYAALRVGEVSVTYTWGEGEGTSKEVSTTTKTVRIPPTIHGAITLSGPTNSATAEANAGAGWSGGTNWPARSAEAYVSMNAAASVTPTSLSATSPVSAIPTSGHYLHRLDAEPYKWDRVRVRAEIVNFADVV